jgi:hypothetical protein
VGGDNEQSSTVQNAANTAKAMRSAQRGARASATSRDGLACGQQVNTHTHSHTRTRWRSSSRTFGRAPSWRWLASAPRSRTGCRRRRSGRPHRSTAQQGRGSKGARRAQPRPLAETWAMQTKGEGGREGGWGFVEGSMRYTPGSRTQLSSDVQPTERFTLCGTTSEPLAQIH